MYKTSNEFMDYLIAKNSNEVEFHQAVKEVIDSIWDYIQDNPEYLHGNINNHDPLRDRKLLLASEPSSNSMPA